MVTRRKFLIGAAALTVGAGYALKPRIGNVLHEPYFAQLSGALKNAGMGSPTLILDQMHCTHNLSSLAAQVGGKQALRVVTKSLPCLNLLDQTMHAWQTQRQMVFNYPMLLHLAQNRPQVELLTGKPLDPIELPHFFNRLQQIAPEFNASRQIQWLVDTPETLRHYLDFAQAQQLPLRFSIELDVGLHRGGVVDETTFNTLLDMIAAEPLAQLSGLMGYDAHVAKVPDIWDNRKQAEQHAKQRYQAFRDLALSHAANRAAPLPREALILNTAGSPTYHLHIADSPANELAIGSAVVKPSDFDLPSLNELQPALFIAAPILKVGEFSLPYGAQAVSKATRLWDPNQAKSVIIHGGEWLAQIVSPTGVQTSDLYGHSTNQKVLTAAANFAYSAGDYVFFRPTQSEMLMLQFGQIAVYDQDKITDLWPVFEASA